MTLKTRLFTTFTLVLNFAFSFNVNAQIPLPTAGVKNGGGGSWITKGGVPITTGDFRPRIIVDQTPNLPGQEFGMPVDFHNLIDEMVKSSKFYLSNEEVAAIKDRDYHYRFVESEAEIIKNEFCVRPKVVYPDLAPDEKEVPAACTTKEGYTYFINSALTKSVMEKNPALFATLMIHEKLTTFFIESSKKVKLVNYDKIDQVVRTVSILHQKRSEQLAGNWTPLNPSELELLNMRLETSKPFLQSNFLSRFDDFNLVKADRFGGIFLTNTDSYKSCNKPLSELLKGKLSIGSVFYCKNQNNILNYFDKDIAKTVAENEIKQTLLNTTQTIGMDEGSVAINSIIIGYVGKNSQIENSDVNWVGENTKVKNSYLRFIGKNSEIIDSSFDTAPANSKIFKLDSVVDRKSLEKRAKERLENTDENYAWTYQALNSNQWYSINERKWILRKSDKEFFAKFSWGLRFSQPPVISDAQMISEATITGKVEIQNTLMNYLSTPGKPPYYGDLYKERIPLNRDLILKNVSLKNTDLKTVDSSDPLVIENVLVSAMGDDSVGKSSKIQILNLGSSVNKIKGLEINALFIDPSNSYFDRAQFDFRPLKNIESTSGIINPCSDNKKLVLNFSKGGFAFSDLSELASSCKIINN